MGKQINYWMDYDNFVLLAQKAIDLGCVIVKEECDSGKVIESRDINIVTENDKDYYFYFPEVGNISIRAVNGKERVDCGFSASSNAIIEAGYSFIMNEPIGSCGKRRKKEIRRARLYCQSGYYDENGDYRSRPECLTKIYNSLARYVKKIAPYTELTDIRVSIKDENYGEEYEYRHKEYITKKCLEMRNSEGYELC